MNTDALRRLLEEVRGGKLDVEAALEQLRDLPYEDIGYARIDHHRALRTGVPEVVFCEGKSPEQVAEIMVRLVEHNPRVIGTRADADAAKAVAAKVPDARYHEVARVIVIDRERKESTGRHYVLVCAAGTSDIPVAEEAAVTARALGSRVERLWDVGVAGLHRLLEHRKLLHEAGVVIAVAGMEGALASVVAGLSGGPVIAVPTSVGYGASFSGLSALLTMINSCAPGVTVVNIDNGFGAGYAAHMILNRTKSRPRED
jgi:NCAIR mutase (PurE)-related protein